MFVVEEDGGWYYYVRHGRFGDYDDAGDVWTIDVAKTTYTCDADTDDCVGLLCATRALEVENYFPLPFPEGANIRAIYDSETFEGMVYLGATSLGLALAATAGAALTLF